MVGLTARSAGKFWAFYPVSGEIPARSAGKFLGHMSGLCQVFQPGSGDSRKIGCTESTVGYRGLDITADGMIYLLYENSEISPSVNEYRGSSKPTENVTYRPHHTRALTSKQHSGTDIHTDTSPLTSAPFAALLGPDWIRAPGRAPSPALGSTKCTRPTPTASSGTTPLTTASCRRGTRYGGRGAAALHVSTLR